ncbi:4Fe-4S dicluster domain-containing protein [Citricoccus nitrophenolicus]|uniref:4Fe-4S dicluster domain-containing protein n=1 Tax=Citricoccus nitrophenolicus TaxID=863575 RepID=A0ABV0IID4_9MICC|nr:4Fe-4S dicluster domain-containing protein [Citricoccus sp. I39-566]WMY77847.1 4Fe-4S dicluster domain-containing protein [Citricoccus sp. I39-566]
MVHLTQRPDAAVDGNPTADAHYEHPHPRKGFFTDTSICIGCKACEVACKEWNQNPVDSDFALSNSSFDNSEGLGADTWRHVAFIEQDREQVQEARASGAALVSLGMPGIRRAAGGNGTEHDAGRAASGALGAAGSGAAGLPPAPELGGLDVLSSLGSSPDRPDSSAVDTTPPDTPEFRWLMSSDVCKHCTNAGCLDVCPTGALFRTEHGTVVVQDDVCNGCGTCVAGCPFGVIERRSDGIAQPKTDRAPAPGAHAEKPKKNKNAGVAQKCTLCYDRMTDGQTPACAQACPTTSIKYGERADMLTSAQERVAQLHAQGRTEARLYGANPNDGVGGTGSVFLLLDEPEVYGLPPDPRVPTRDLPRMYARAGIAMAGMVAAAGLAFLGGGRR